MQSWQKGYKGGKGGSYHDDVSAAVQEAVQQVFAGKGGYHTQSKGKGKQQSPSYSKYHDNHNPYYYDKGKGKGKGKTEGKGWFCADEDCKQNLLVKHPHFTKPQWNHDNLDHCKNCQGPKGQVGLKKAAAEKADKHAKQQQADLDLVAKVAAKNNTL